VTAHFWRHKRVLVTGHTGFKGSWLALWLQRLGAQVAGYALPPPPDRSLFSLANVGHQMQSYYADIRDSERLERMFEEFRPEIVFHLAAQPLVRLSYLIPVETYEVNVMGTVRLLDAARKTSSCRVVVNITSDKCYENREWAWGYRESDPMGGRDPYSSSKGCAELVTAAYRSSFFDGENTDRQMGLASARAGNVIGGGDFSKDRIIPDIMAAVTSGRPLFIRNPDAVRPWQHVLEPLSGYLLLAEKLWADPLRFSQGWNFGPSAEDLMPVRWVVEKLLEYSDGHVRWQIDSAPKPHEAHLLMLDSSQARLKFGWTPRWNLEQALRSVAEWHTAYSSGELVRGIVLRQIEAYEKSKSKTQPNQSRLAGTVADGTGPADC
jgi:CDP-glucose 4,6-dehydratase